jgi:hypothetical protein
MKASMPPCSPSVERRERVFSGSYKHGTGNSLSCLAQFDTRKQLKRAYQCCSDGDYVRGSHVDEPPAIETLISTAGLHEDEVARSCDISGRMREAGDLVPLALLWVHGIICEDQHHGSHVAYTGNTVKIEKNSHS